MGREPSAGRPAVGPGAGDGYPRVKICGVGRRRDVEAAARAGASYVGLVLAESPRRLAAPAAAALAAAARRAGLVPVGVFVDVEAGRTRHLAARVGIDHVQLHGEEPPGACDALREAGLAVWKAIRPRDPDELERLAGRFAEAADALLVEGHSPERAGGTGTGVPAEWLERLDPLRAATTLVLAGGLDPDNVAEAVRRVRPDVVDVSSGVERAPGEKDPDRIRAFVRRARGEDRARGQGAPRAQGEPPGEDPPGEEGRAGGEGR